MSLLLLVSGVYFAELTRRWTVDTECAA